MTARQVWEACLIETAKEGAPALLLEDFNYLINRAVRQYINKRYTVYDINQQTTDDLRVLKATATLTPQKISQKDISEDISLDLFGKAKYINLPLDYFHMLNCICVFKVKNRFKCYDEGNLVQFPAIRLTADAWSNVINNYYTRPLPQRPYYYINHVNISEELPTNPINKQQLDSDFSGTDASQDYSVENSNLPRVISLSGITNTSLVEQEAGTRYGNPSNVRCEIRYGNDDNTFELVAVIADYIKTPQLIRLTQDQVNITQDTSQIMEFPDYVCQEIINELVTIIMAQVADPRMQYHVASSVSIPQGQQQST